MVNPKKITGNLFIIAVVLMLLGSLFKLMHFQWCDQLIILSGLVYIIFVFYCLAEIWASKNIGIREKIIWLIFLILLPFITGLIYILSARKKII